MNVARHKFYKSTSIYSQVEDSTNENNSSAHEQTISQFITDPNKFTTNFPIGFRKVKRENEGCDERFNIIKTQDEMIEAEESIYKFKKMFQKQSLLKYLESSKHGTMNKLAVIEANSSLLNDINGSVQQINLTAGGLFKFWDMDEDF
uniref:Uncharacterized protein n=1 Tax=viral metagenome TaxID=1070528 RepID=A0A6C0F3E8_9ZZZZ